MDLGICYPSPEERKFIFWVRLKDFGFLDFYFHGKELPLLSLPDPLSPSYPGFLLLFQPSDGEAVQAERRGGGGQCMGEGGWGWRERGREGLVRQCQSDGGGAAEKPEGSLKVLGSSGNRVGPKGSASEATYCMRDLDQVT